MFIDIIALILLAMAIFKGYRRGFIVSILSFLAILIGLAAAMKFSVAVADWLQNNTNIGSHWLPFISFLLIMVAVSLAVRWIANIVEAAIEIVLLGWLNKLGGIILYVLLFMMVYSIILFYATQMDLLKEATIQSSQTYAIIEPWGPKAINALGYIIPFFKDMFTDLQHFFSNVSSSNYV